MAEQNTLQDLESRLIALETLVAYQDRTISDLDQVIQEQYRLIEGLQRQLALIEEGLKEGALLGDHNLQDDKPPHY